MSLNNTNGFMSRLLSSHVGEGHEVMAPSSIQLSTTGTACVLVLVSDTPQGAVGLRAGALFERVVGEQFAVHMLYREHGNRKALPRFLKALYTTRPDVLYLHNIGWAGAMVGLWAKCGLGIPL